MAGIEQINQALTQVDQVTQFNASNAEESASASEELFGQVRRLKTLVTRFRLANKSAAGEEMSELNVNDLIEALDPAEVSAPATKKVKKSKSNGKNKKNGKSKKVQPSKLIALDDSGPGEL